MARWQPAPIVGGAYSDDSKPWSAQDCVNFIVTPAERGGTRSPGKLTCLPGYTTFCATMQEAPVRGLHDVEGLLLAVTGDTLYRIGTDGAATAIGTIPGVGRVSMAHNQVTYGHEVMIANGQSGYVYNTYTGAFGQVTDEGFSGFTVCDFVDGYIAGVEPQGRFWAHSMLRQATSYNTLDRYDAESAPDKMVSLIVSHREVMVLNQRSSAFFRNTGATTGTFQNSNGTEMEVGCASPFAVARLDNTVYWLGSDGTVYRLAGHSPQRVSTGPIEQAIGRCDMGKAFAFTFEDRGHKVFYLTFPDGQTWGYDVWTNEWHRRASKDLNRWRIDSLIKWNGKWIAGDFSNGKLYQLDWAVQSEAGEEMERRRISAVLHDNGNRVTVNAVKIEVDTGLGANSTPLPDPILSPLSISGDLPDGYVGDAGTYQYTVSGGVLPYGDFTITAGSLPPGATMDAAGLVTYDYTTEGSYSWTVQGVDASGSIATLVDAAEVLSVPWFAVSQDGPVTAEGQASDDGAVWMSPMDPNLGGSGVFSGVGALVVVTNNGGRTSFDNGETWTSHVGDATTVLVRGDYADGVYYIGSNGGAVNDDTQQSRRSTDAINYTRMTLPSNLRRINKFIAFGALTYGFGTASADGNCATTADGGVTWGGMATCFTSNVDANCAATDGSKMIAVGNSNLIGQTADGAAWTAITSPFAGTGAIEWIVYGGGLWVMVSASGEIASSPTADTGSWTIAAYTLPTAPNEIEYSHGRWIIVGQGGRMTTSTDGLAWTSLANSFGATANILGITAHTT